MTIQTGRFTTDIRGQRRTIAISYDAAMDAYDVHDASAWKLGTIDLVARTVTPDLARCDAADLIAIATGAAILTPVKGHQPRCRRCHRELTSPESIAAGIGPDCADAEAARLAA